MSHTTPLPFPKLLNISELDFISAVVTFLAGLLWNLAYGILVGVGVQLVFVLYSIARPKVAIEERKVSQFR